MFIYRDPEGSKLVSLAEVCRHLYDLQSMTLPKTAATLEEIAARFMEDEVMKEYGMTGDSVFYRGTDENHGFVLFASDFISSNLYRTQRHYFADGTFRVVPKNTCFTQLYIIHVEYKGHVSKL